MVVLGNLLEDLVSVCDLSGGDLVGMEEKTQVLVLLPQLGVFDQIPLNLKILKKHKYYIWARPTSFLLTTDPELTALFN